MTEDEAMLLSAYLDGELDAKDRADIEKLLETDADAAKYYSGLLRATATLKPAYADAMVAPSPDPLAAKIRARRPDAGVRLLDLARAWLRPQVLAGCAAMLVAGFALGNMAVPSLTTSANGPVLVSNGRLVAGHALAGLLDANLSGDAVDARGIVRASFKMESGGYFCRQFSAGNATGLACKRDESWSIEVLANQPTLPAGSYAMAGNTPVEVEDALKRLGGGETMDRDAEAEAIGAGWKR